MRWPARAKAGLVSTAFVSLSDLAPTFLRAAGLTPPDSMSARSMLDVAAGGKGRGEVFIERERHANVRKGDLSYPVRAVRTDDWLYIRNMRPERWPAGDPQMYVAVGPYGDIDGGLSKTLCSNGGHSLRLHGCSSWRRRNGQQKSCTICARIRHR